MSKVVVIEHRAEVARLLVERLRENHVVELRPVDGEPVDCVVYSPPLSRREDIPDLADAETIFRQCACAGIRQFVLISSAAIYGATPQNPGLIRETRALLKEDRFRIARAWTRIEQLAEKQFSEDVALAILRPAAVLAHGSEDYFTRLFRSHLAITLPGHEPSLQLLSPRDLADSVKCAVERRAVGVFNVAPRSVIPLRKALRLAHVKRLPVPRILQRPARAVMNPLRLVHPIEQLDYIRYSWSVSGEKIKHQLGFEPTHSSAAALAEFSVATKNHLPVDVETQFDDFGMDTRYVSALGRTVFRFLEHYYWRIEIKGLEQIPHEGPAVLVGMHRGFMPWDGIMLIQQLFRLIGRCPRFLMHPGLVKMPFCFNFLTKLGGVIACQDNADLMLKRGELLGVFPEGLKGAFSLYRDAYRLQKFGRNDFVKMALRHQAPIVPFVTIGSAEILPIVKKFEWEWWKRRTEWPCLPLTLSPLPLPSKWHTQFLAPVEIKDVYPPEAAADPATVRAISVEVRSRMEEAIERILSRRKSIFFGSVFEQEAS
jgi:1-acyl-sn-glycerol-3-phosphate acyltransferase/nucleoside-diphosphate-sugar epimerase